MQFELTFQPTIPLVTVIRRTVTSIFDRVLGDRERSARLALATHELLENVVRHSTDGQTTLQIHSSEDTRGRVTIETRNKARREDITDLTAQALAMATADPEVFYLELMVERADSADDGGLGIARIRAEADMLVDVYDEGEYVRIVASMPLSDAA